MMLAMHSCSTVGVTLAAADGQLFLDLLPWLLALLALVIVGGVCMYAAKRLLQSGDQSVPEGFSLQSLRDLHAAGELSDEEFAKAKAAMIGQVKQTKEIQETPTGDENVPLDAADKNVPKNEIDPLDNGPIGS